MGSPRFLFVTGLVSAVRGIPGLGVPLVWEVAPVLVPLPAELGAVDWAGGVL